LAAAGVQVEPDDSFPGMRRCYSTDPVGNRLELLEPAA
jgi:predicted enzyme related to lactoylglutathione lyase